MTQSNQGDTTKKEIKAFIKNLDEITTEVICMSSEPSQAINSNIEQAESHYITVYDLCFFIKKTYYPNWKRDGDNKESVRFKIINRSLMDDLPKFINVIIPLKRKIVIQCEQVKLYIKSSGIYGGFNEFSNITICEILNLLIDGWHYLLKNGYVFTSSYNHNECDDYIDNYDLFNTLSCSFIDCLDNLYIPREIAETVFNYPKEYRPDGYNEQKELETNTHQLKAELKALKNDYNKVVAELEKAKKELNSRKHNNSTIETKDQVIEGLCYMVQRETNLKETWKHLNIQKGIITKTSLSKVLNEILECKLNISTPTRREQETIIKNLIDTKDRD